jgi:hypothetical protein
MELYTTPPTFPYPQNWEKQLVLHETRHVGQMSKLSQHFFHVAEYLIGQQSQGLAAGGYVSKWMFEGDAVLSETEHSFSGRGRQASFLMPYRAFLMDSISFSWDIWRFGSYKYQVPNDYQFGYYLLSAIRYGSRMDFLSDIYDKITKRPYIPYVSQMAYRETTGKTYTTSWTYATDIMRSIWNQQLLQNGTLSPYHTLTDSVSAPKNNRPETAYADYESITVISIDSVYAFYRNLNRTQSLVRIDSSGQRRHVRFVGNVNSDITEGGGKLYWTEIIPDLRWEQASFSLLRSYDPKTNTITSLSQKSRYQSPSISPSALIVAVVHTFVAGGSALHLLATSDGTYLTSYPAPENGQIQSSAWASESLLYAAVLTDSGVGIYALDLETETWNTIVQPQYQTIARLSFHNGLLWFGSDLNGIDNVYVIDPHTIPAQLFMLTNAKYGAFCPYLYRNTLYYTNFTHAGSRPVSVPVDSLVWKRANFNQPYESPIAKELSQQVQFRIDTVGIPDRPNYHSKPYRKVPNLFRVHSWAPIYYNALDNIVSLSLEDLYHTVSFGAMLFSQNTLSTAVTQLGYAYRNGFHAGHLKFIYRGWYPVVELSGDLNDRNVHTYKIRKGENNQSVSVRDTLFGKPSLRASANVYIPFNLRSKGWVRGLIPRLYLSFRNDQYYLLGKEVFDHYSSLQYGIQYYQYRPMTVRNIFPRWGFGLSLQTASVPWMRDAFGAELYMMAYGYLPGLFSNQGIRLKAAYQRQWIEGKRYYLSNLASFPRGYESKASLEYTGFSIDYAIPIWLGDKSLGSIFYFKRLQINPFADWAHNRNQRGTERLYAVGADLLLQFHFFQIGSPISAGVRSIVKADGTTAFQMLFDIAIQ